MKKVKITQSTYDSGGVLLPEGAEIEIGDEAGQVSAEDTLVLIEAKKAKEIV